MRRRKFLQQSTLATAGFFMARESFGAAGAAGNFPVVRIPESGRKFKSISVEKTIREVRSNIGNKEIGWLFENCFPNTLDTTVEFGLIGGKPDTFVITGDIDAMWLRDSSAQIWPYLPLIKTDPELQQLIKGVINRQAKCILIDPYANAFNAGPTGSEWDSDRTDMKPELHERKWEVDSLCYPIRLAYNYWKTSGDNSFFDENWQKAGKLIVSTFKEQQRKNGVGPYHFQRKTEVASDTAPNGGYGNPVKPVGLICSIFRPSDDATIFPFLIPSNYFAVVSLRQMAEMFEQIKQDHVTGSACRVLAIEVDAALQKYAVGNHPVYGKVLAYEV